MRDLKPMPEADKFEHAFEMVRLYQKYVLPFVEEHMGFEEMHNLRSIWQAAITPIDNEASHHDKYWQAYSNWQWMAHCSHNALADQLSADEVLEYKRLLLHLYMKTLNQPGLAVLRFLNLPIALARALLYEMQWMTPLEITLATRSQVTCVVHSCKVRQTAGTDRICRVDCQNVGKAYARRLYGLNRQTTLSDHGCSITLTPSAPRQD